MRVAIGLVLCLLLSTVPATSAQNETSDEQAWPGEPVSYTHLTLPTKG